jgi:hypothetical protein
MKCSNPDCNRGIGLVAYRRGWFSKRRYCSRHCRDALVVDAPKPQQKRSTIRALVGGKPRAIVGFRTVIHEISRRLTGAEPTLHIGLLGNLVLQKQASQTG